MVSGCRIPGSRQSNATASARIPAATPNRLQPYVYNRDIGSSKKLLGKCLFINIFISDQETSFSEDHKKRCLDSLRKAIAFLLDKAEEYNKSFADL